MTVNVPVVGPVPAFQQFGDAGADLAATEGAVLHSGQWGVIPTGVKVAIPDGYAGLVTPRSGLAAKYGVTVLNSPGLIDSGYRGDIGVVLINHGQKPFVVRPGDRVAQLVIVPVAAPQFVPVEALDETERGGGGFGSTGGRA